MNHNKEVPDNIKGLGDMLPADMLKVVNELLERVHQADTGHQGNTVFIYAPGSQYVERQINIGETHPGPPCIGREKSHIHQTKTQSHEERIRQCIALLMTERYGEEPLFCLQGHWQAVYRILVDKGYCRDSDFDGFDTFIQRVMPEEVNKPYKKESVKQISKTDFALPFERWHYDPLTSTTRKPYDRMVTIATRFKEILEENGL